ncbi:hypothetical protein RDWZM_000296 [Blomia tropicalis]|uniref:Lipid droplet-associated hydrolase n=1 Tax=Blomia tropicalis TaxID=40697 RepID=A0A9Q0RPH3_BLOTA|nr:hypothetical protein BLOT_012995 [Blomia tropicalis]KAJ6221751.1 hypothetical protein RDWZM_000296 [Blomia tropicalis]
MIKDGFDDPIGIIKFITINGVPTKIVIYDSNPIEIPFDYDRLILMISGNPGEIEYYRNYLWQVHQKTKLPVIGISNSGHNRLPSNLSMPNVYQNGHLYGLNGQIQNKRTFIDQFISKRTKLILLGHSIGTYMIIELLDQFPQINNMVDHCILLMPTIEHIGQTAMGQKVAQYIRWGYYPLLSLAYILDLMTQRFKNILANYVLRKDVPTLTASKYEMSQLVPKSVIEAATNLFNPNCVRALIYMTETEFKQVQEANIEAIDLNKNKLTFLCSENDHWFPKEFFEKLQRRLPDQVDMKLCLGQIIHAFVVDREATEHIANLTFDIIKNVINC